MQDHVEDIKQQKVFGYFKDKVLRFLRYVTVESRKDLLKLHVSSNAWCHNKILIINLLLRETLHYTEHTDEEILKVCGTLATNSFEVTFIMTD